MSSMLEKPMVFKDFKSAVDFAHKEYYKDIPRYMVEQYVFFGDKYPEVLEKIMTGGSLTKDEQELMNAGKEFKHTAYKDGDVIDDAVEFIATEDASQELIDKLFTDDVKPEDSEVVKPEDVPEPINNEKIKEIMAKNDLEEDNGLSNF
jgi:hypothetical protein